MDKQYGLKNYNYNLAIFQLNQKLITNSDTGNLFTFFLIKKYIIFK